MAELAAGRRVKFYVPGLAVQEGNLSVAPHGKAYHREGKRLQDWRDDVGVLARDAFKGAPHAGPVQLVLTFCFPITQRIAKSGQMVSAKTTRPDVDKLARAVLDALTGIMFEDDAQVYDLHARKLYVSADVEGPGVRVEVVLEDAGIEARV